MPLQPLNLKHKNADFLKENYPSGRAQLVRASDVSRALLKDIRGRVPHRDGLSSSDGEGVGVTIAEGSSAKVSHLCVYCHHLIIAVRMRQPYVSHEKRANVSESRSAPCDWIGVDVRGDDDAPRQLLSWLRPAADCENVLWVNNVGRATEQQTLANVAALWEYGVESRASMQTGMCALHTIAFAHRTIDSMSRLL